MFLKVCLTVLWFVSVVRLTTVPSELLAVPEPGGADGASGTSPTPPQMSDTEECTLRGRVVNAVTGEPIRNALVQVTLEKMRSMLTLADGSFQFGGLPAGEGSVAVRKPGYFSESDVHPLSAGTPRVILAADAPAVTLKLVPEGVIFGTIQDEYGEPVEGMAVRLIRVNLSTGRKRQERQAEMDTNEVGKYRFAELPPGTYYLSAGKWLEAAEGAHDKGVASKAKGYPTELYPGVTDLSAATPIKIVAGKRMQIDLSVAEKPLYRVAGTVTGYAEAQPVAFQIADMTGEVLSIEPDFNARTGRFQFAALPPGSFTVMARGVDASGRASFSTKQVNVNSEVSNLHLHLAGASTIEVSMQREFSHGQQDENAVQGAAPATVTLRPQGGSLQNELRLTPRGSDPLHPNLAILDVEPGTYAAQVEPREGGYIYSAKYGPIDLLREDLTIAADAPPQTIEVVVRDDSATLSGTLTSDGRKTAGAVLLVPGRAPRLLMLIPADSNGSFQFSNLAPGDYTVVGLDHVDDIEYRDADFLRKYLPMGQEITVSPDQSAVVQLELVHVGE
jgi:hypothetical protein